MPQKLIAIDPPGRSTRSLGQRPLAAAPDPVDRGDGVERLVGPGQREHVPSRRSASGRALAGHVDERLGRVDAGGGRAGGRGEADGEAGPAGDVEQRDARPARRGVGRWRG